METKKKNKSNISVRFNVLFFFVFILFSVLVIRLGFVQIVYGESFRREVERTEDVIVKNPMPRGEIVDRFGRSIVANEPQRAITYTRQQDTSTKKMVETARKLAAYIEKDTKKVTEREKKDFWILKYPERAENKVTKKEKRLIETKEMSEKELYNLQLDRITAKELKELTSDDLEVLAIYREMTSGYALTTQFIKNKDVTDKEFAIVSESLDDLPGVDTTVDWHRTNKFGNTLSSVLGAVTSTEEGLPKEEADKFVAMGYGRNERVGKSYLEMQYEDVLSGKRERVKNVTYKGTTIKSSTVSKGQRGDDLVLTIDMDLQKKVERIVSDELVNTKRSYGDTPFLDRAYVVLADPYSGEIRAIAGKRYVRDKKTGEYKVQDDALGTFTTSYTMGSVVKGATVLTGYQTGAIAPGNYEVDEPIVLKGTQVKKSYSTFGSINDLKALKVSSNVYMFKTAMKIGGTHYVPNGTLNLQPDTFSIMRNTFAQFGLGVKTGIDLPNETSGMKNSDTTPGLALDLAIGQNDTYTPLQLVQYVSAIANGGNRVKPHLVKQIRQPAEKKGELGPVLSEVEPVVLNRLDMKPEWVERIQEGFRMVMQEQGGTGYSTFGGKDYNPAGKTGTAQAFYDGPDRKKYGKEPPPTWNITLIGYAPYNNPEIAMSVVVPWAYQSNDHGMNKKIGSKVLDAYFDLKKKREGGTNTDETSGANEEGTAN
ncbi:peptidoglycan D,D-transpeptidase FtsI family protein [Peribacillus deserti]|uniref:serine-type D-Ala-D-Ala carboxypeptidase n=1 Tax=Peribacillus deserti TaxID=673318 RepID=A0A2N5M344_9BACI|nr:penicillin-binding protein 2 [Peribacillus deserti]PLT28788.1 penicillin-binding protein [Peribacillus deserti]